MASLSPFQGDAGVAAGTLTQRSTAVLIAEAGNREQHVTQGVVRHLPAITKISTWKSPGPAMVFAAPAWPPAR